MIHPTSEVLSKKIGENTRIWQFVIIGQNAIIGSNCNINSHVFIENDVIIGDNVTIKCGVQIWDAVILEDNVFIGPNVTFTNELTPRSKQYPTKFIKTIVKKGASIGANATILAGNEIGKYAMIGAGSVVTKPIGKNELWVGNPAKHAGFVTNEGKILDKKLYCKNSSKRFIWTEDNLIESKD